MSHTYNEKNAELAFQLILNDYKNALYGAYQNLKNEL